MRGHNNDQPMCVSRQGFARRQVGDPKAADRARDRCVRDGKHDGTTYNRYLAEELAR